MPASATAARPSLAARKAASVGVDKSQLQFDWLLGDRQWWTLSAAATACGVSESFIEKLFDAGSQISGHEYNGGSGARMTKRIPRAWLVAFLVNASRYSAETRLQAYLSCLRHFTREERQHIARAALQL